MVTKESGAALLAAFDQRAAAEFQRIDEMRKEGGLPVGKAAVARLTLRKAARGLRDALDEEFASLRKNGSEDSGAEMRARERRASVVNQGLEQESGVVRDAIDALALAAEEASREFLRQMEETPAKELVILFVVALLSYLMLFGIDLVDGYWKEGPCKHQNPIAEKKLDEPKAASGGESARSVDTDPMSAMSHLPLLNQPCRGTIERTESSTWPRSAGKDRAIQEVRNEWKCIETAAETTEPAVVASGSNGEQPSSVPASFWERLKTTFLLGMCREDATQQIAVKSIRLLVNVMFVLSLSGFILALLRWAGLPFGDKLSGLLQDGLKTAGAGGDSAGVGGPASGLATLLTVKVLIGVAVAGMVGVTALHSYYQGADVARNSMHVEKYTERLVVPPSNTELIEALKNLQKAIDIIGQPPKDSCTRDAKGNCVPAGGEKGCCEPPKISLLDKEAASALGTGFGTGIGNVINAANSGLRVEVENLKTGIGDLKKESRENSNRAERLKLEMMAYCTNLLTLQYQIKSDLRILDEKKVGSTFPEHPLFSYGRLNVDCRPLLAERCSPLSGQPDPGCSILPWINWVGVGQ